MLNYQSQFLLLSTGCLLCFFQSLLQLKRHLLITLFAQWLHIKLVKFAPKGIRPRGKIQGYNNTVYKIVTASSSKHLNHNQKSMCVFKCAVHVVYKKLIMTHKSQPQFSHCNINDFRKDFHFMKGTPTSCNKMLFYLP